MDNESGELTPSGPKHHNKDTKTVERDSEQALKKATGRSATHHTDSLVARAEENEVSDTLGKVRGELQDLARDDDSEVAEEPIGEITDAKERDPHRDTSFKIIFCQHTPEFASAVAAELRDSDIIVIESYDPESTIDEKAEKADRMTRYLDPLASPLMKAADEVWMSSRPFIHSVLKELKGSGKRVELMDAVRGSDVEVLTTKAKQAADEYQLYLGDHNTSSKLRPLLTTKIEANAQERIGRDRLNQATLGMLAWRGEPGKKQNIGVISGGYHDGYEQPLEDEGYSISRAYIGPDRFKTPEGIRYEYWRQAQQPNLSEVQRDELIDRALLTDEYATYFRGKFAADLEEFGVHIDPDVEDNIEIERNIIDRMPIEKIREIQQQLDRATEASVINEHSQSFMIGTIDIDILLPQARQILAEAARNATQN